MLSRILGEKRVYSIFVFLYSGIALGLPCNKVILSICTLLLFALTLLDFNKVAYKEAIIKNKILQVLSIFLFIHLLSFFWSENIVYFLKDFNSKLPLYSLPLVLVLKPLKNRKDIRIVFGIFLLSVTIVSVLNLFLYFGDAINELKDIRNLSFFISHIRFGLMVLFGITICTFWLKTTELKFKIIPFILIIYLLIYTYLAEVFICYIGLITLLIVVLFFQIKNGQAKKIYLGILLLFVIVFSALYFANTKGIIEKNTKPLLSELKTKTVNGNYYEHDLKSNYFLNGNFVYANVCRYEIIKEWEKISKVRINDYNINSHKYYFLVQYMTSKGLVKDSVGFQKLTSSDIKNIENGAINYKKEKLGFFNKIESLQNEFSDPNPNGKTILQRWEYLKAGYSIFIRNWLIGVGSGDIQDEFNTFYEKTNSNLLAENRLRTHNQFAAYFISFGILGGILFILIFSIFLKSFLKQKSLLPILFITIILTSFLSEDTLETQMGVTFFALFFGIFISSQHCFTKTNPDANE